MPLRLQAPKHGSMFQTFSAPSSPADAADRVRRLRVLMTKANIDVLLVPRADEHQGEYVPPSAERLKWLTGFSGSAGLAAIGTRSAALFVDGRYTVQARTESDPRLFELPGLARTKLTPWLSEKLPAGAIVGFDPWVHTGGEIERLAAQLKAKGIKLKPTARNLVDRVWGRSRPRAPEGPVVLHAVKYAGRPAADKIADLQKRLKDERQDAVLLTLPDSIAWLFNIRGSDVAHNPVALAFAIVPAHGKAELFLAPSRFAKDARSEIEGLARLSPPARLPDRIKALKASPKRVRLDPETAAAWFIAALGPRSVVRAQDPCIAAKAVKNAAEIRGARAAHVRDGAAVTRFLAWLDRVQAEGTLDEIGAVEALERFRREAKELEDISFDTISGSGANGAIVHYRVNESTNRRLAAGELFLIDSGAQYRDGTTDITRTIAVGMPTAEMRERFTLVLKGHIAIATARFPKGTRGIDLDPFARRALWQRGLDYDHGTGHGVGSFLSVHEGPQSISRAGMAQLEPGMILSNEPGYYKEGAYGIRIENLVLVLPAERLPGSDRETMSFETLTLAPIDRRLVVRELLSRDEIAWLDAYHARVLSVIGPEVDADARAWLEAATAPI